MNVTCAFIALNEEKNIGRALDSVQWAEERLVVDSGSSDRTIEIAKAKGARVLSHPFVDFASQKNFALQQASREWVFFLDCDEICEDALRDSIFAAPKNSPEASGFWVRRRNYFLGKELRFGANANDFQMRFFRKRSARFKNYVHEVVEIDGPAAWIRRGAIHHYTKSSLSDFFSRFDLYTSLEAQALFDQQKRVSRSTCLWKPIARFVYFYFLKGGFLDGFHGFVYHVLSLYYYFVKLLKTRERFGAI